MNEETKKFELENRKERHGILRYPFNKCERKIDSIINIYAKITFMRENHI